MISMTDNIHIDIDIHNDYSNHMGFTSKGGS